VAKSDSTGMTPREYFGLVRRHLLLILVIPVLAAGGAYLYAGSQVPMYAASSVLLYQQAIDPSNPSANQGYVDPNAQQMQVQSATTLIMGPEIAKRVASSQGTSLPPFDMQATVVTPDQSGAGSSYSTGVTVQVTSSDPQWAARLANAFATTFIAWRAEQQRAALTDAAKAVSAQLDQLTTPLQQASSEYVILRERLQDLEVRAATVTGDFTLVVPATVPSVPYAPNPTRSAVMAFGVGLVAGFGIALLREKLDTRTRSSREVGDLLGLPIVGRIPTIVDGNPALGRLVVLSDRDGQAADAYRLVRTNLEFTSMGEEHRALMVISALQGEGKSTASANLAASLALAGNRVLLVDGDLRRPRVHTLFGLRNAVGVSSIIAGMATFDDAVQMFDPAAVVVGAGAIRSAAQMTADTGGSASALWVLTAGPQPPNPGEMVASQRFAALIEGLKPMAYDYILVDSPAFLAVGDSSALAAGVDGLLVVVNVKMARRPVLEEFRDRLGRLPVAKLGIIIVGEKIEGGKRYDYYGSRGPS
jgi:succinoglycan biosynthesis transport protein ExoP